MIRLMTGICLLAACSQGDGAEQKQSEEMDVRGSWRGVLTSPGGPLPFTVRIDGAREDPPAVIFNGRETTPVSRMELEERDVRLYFGEEGARVEAELMPRGERMSGAWRKGDASLPFNATRGEARRFVKKPNRRAAFDEVSGDWRVTMTGGDRRGEGALELSQEGREVTGTIELGGRALGALAGSFDGGLLRLSRFDGREAILLRGRARSDGSLRGDLWSGAEEHALWRAER